LPLPSGLEIFELKSFTSRMTQTRRRQVTGQGSDSFAERLALGSPHQS
jgi:hypothetical protein